MGQATSGGQICWQRASLWFFTQIYLEILEKSVELYFGLRFWSLESKSQIYRLFYRRRLKSIYVLALLLHHFSLYRWLWTSCILMHKNMVRLSSEFLGVCWKIKRTFTYLSATISDMLRGSIKTLKNWHQFWHNQKLCLHAKMCACIFYISKMTRERWRLYTW